MKLLLLLALQLTLNGAVNAAVFEFRFWPGPMAKKDSRFIEMNDGACGDVATAKVRSIPKYDEKAAFQPERVFELDSKGRILKSWNIPVDALPYALDKSSLLFDYSSTVYRVSPSGKVSKVGNLDAVTSAEIVECVMPKAFLGSDYATCWALSDVRTKKVRIVAFQGPCT